MIIWHSPFLLLLIRVGLCTLVRPHKFRQEHKGTGVFFEN